MLFRSPIHGTWPFGGHPVGDEKTEDEAVEDVLAEIQRNKRLACILAIAVNTKGY